MLAGALSETGMLSGVLPETAKKVREQAQRRLSTSMLKPSEDALARPDSLKDASKTAANSGAELEDVNTSGQSDREEAKAMEEEAAAAGKCKKLQQDFESAFYRA